MIRTSDFHVGQMVVYRPWPGACVARREPGIVTAITESYVFVCYGYDDHSKATYPGDLEPVG